VNAYWLDDPNHTPIRADMLTRQGLIVDHCEAQPAAYQPILDKLIQTHGYGTQDEIALQPDTSDLEELLTKFTPEHHHAEDEVRYVLDGEGIFDVRSIDDRWMRIEVAQGDLLIVPALRFHRFFLTERKTIHCVRLFQNPSGWVAHYRA
jgi:1,2-dihydroxy-3-keto-5-methylthiopentene dioxygenase